MTLTVSKRAPLRAKILAGDLRMFYLLWLTAVEADVFAKDAPEPLPGVGPLDGALEAFADFFQIDADLVAAAAERNALVAGGELQSSDIEAAIRAFPDKERIGLLSRLYDGDPFVGVELRRRVRESVAERTWPPKARTVGELRTRAAEIATARKRAAATAALAERQRREEVAAAARKKRLAAVAARGELAWREVDNEIERRNAFGYDRAKALLDDLRDVASSQGTTNEFERRVGALRQKHARKGQFIERLRSFGRS